MFIIIIILSIQIFFNSRRKYKFYVNWTAYDKNMKKIKTEDIKSKIIVLYTSYDSEISIKPITSNYIENVYVIKSSKIPLNSYTKCFKYYDNVINIADKNTVHNMIIANDTISIYLNDFTGNINIARKDLVISH